jgi:hypothetical protein
MPLAEAWTKSDLAFFPQLNDRIYRLGQFFWWCGLDKRECQVPRWIYGAHSSGLVGSIWQRERTA